MRSRLVYLLAGLAAVAAVVAFGFVFIHSAGAADTDPVKAPENLLYCGACHSMEKEVLTWQANAHKSVACLECHAEADPGWVRHEFVDRNDDMATLAQVHPLELKVLDQRCEECHEPQMDQLLKDITPKPVLASTKAPNASKPMETKALHDKHIKGSAALKCVDCHTTDAHGPTEGSTPWRDTTHKLCLDCHAEKQVKIAVTGSTSCGACHVQPAAVAPADHKDQAAWKIAHGDSAGNGTCGQCHLAESAGPHTQISSPDAFPSATKDACASCHAGVPMPHPDNFLSTHGKVSLASKAGTCESCHAATSMTGTAPKTTMGSAQSCDSCHAQPMPHPAGYLAIHGDKALAAPSSCTTCHSPANPANPGAAYASAGYCLDCHLQPMPHPATFLAAHGMTAQKAPATCEACHSPKNQAKPTAPHANASYCSTCHDAYEHSTGWVAAHGSAVTESCATCHTLMGQPGQHNACSTCHSADGTWHPDMWYIKHANVVNKQGDAACVTCHNEVEPSCSKCHRDR
ncbi:MAG TPA: cytochrome c3 family protein [Symbiobacteriaceae bacterium]|nr:cytochrome c3 family protein [Symbiobacteriaceae bacterium]